MALEPGTQLGSYTILAPLAQGHAGEAYKASDTKLNLAVVVQVIPPAVSADPGQTERFERDARTISSLSHPNICAPYDVGHQNGTDYFVTEYVEGETLAERLKRGPFELDDALKVAVAIADALDKAHRQGVTHRGLNPSNVLLTAGGPKLLDFGLARLTSPAGLIGSSASMPTRSIGSALAAVPAFAAPYVAPELWEGIDADARADVFAAGAILYEMVAGKPAFEGRTQALLVAAIATVDPDPVSKSQPMAPPALDHVVKRCLAKNPKVRLQTAWDLMGQLQWITEGGTQVGIPAPVAATRKKRERMIWAGVAGASLVAVGLTPAALSSFRSSPQPEQIRFVVSNMGAGPVPLSVSPNGRWITNSRGGVNRGVDGLLLGSVTPQVLIGDNVVTQPFWSPDSRFIAFFEDGKLKKGDVSGGPTQNICDAPSPIAGGTWNSDGVIVFSGGGVLQRVLAAGGQPTAITELDQSKQETEHLAPYFLPDGRHYLFLAVSAQAAESAIYVGALDSKERTRLLATESKATYAAPGYLLFNRGGTVFAQPFDAGELTLSGEPVRVADGVPTLAQGPNASASLGRTASFAVSQTGVLAYRTGGAAAAPGGNGNVADVSLVWFNRTGARTGQVGVPGGYAGVDLSPDGKQVAVHRHEGTGGDNWLFDLVQGRMQRLTFDAAQENSSPVWSPDGTRIAFGSNRDSKWGLYVKLADGTGREELITESALPKAPMSWSPDGKFLVYTLGAGPFDIWAVPIAGDRKPLPILQTQYNEANPQISPDGKWLAYHSTETGRAEIYIKPFPEGPGKWQVSVDGGQFPRWRGDGKELYFVQNPGIMVADIGVVGSSVQSGVPRLLFGLGGNPSLNVNHANYSRYAVSADGQRFLVPQPGAGTAVSGGLADNVAALADRGGTGVVGISPDGVTVVLNWPQILKKK